MIDALTDVNGRGKSAWPSEAAATDTAGRRVLPVGLHSTRSTMPVQRELAKGFAALADPARLRVISILAALGERRGLRLRLRRALGKSQPTVSHHLKVLGDAGLVVGDRRGKWVWYSLVPDGCQLFDPHSSSDRTLTAR